MLALVLITCASRGEAFSLLDRSTWPGWMNPSNWPFTLIPIPEVATDPNAGTTYGLLMVALFEDSHKQISSIFAPDLNNNTKLGFGGGLRYFAYPSEDTEWYALTEFHENIERRVDLDYSTGRQHQSQWSFEGRLFFERDPTERFFGIGNNTGEGGESNYTTEQVYVRGLIGWNATENFQMALVSRPRFVRIQEGAFNTIPQTIDLYRNVKGINGGSEIYNEARATYDTRDSVDIPHSGGLIIAYYGLADRRFMSSVSYNRTGVDFHHYWTVFPRLTIATHAYLQYIPAGNETPFWAMARLGGDESQLYDQQTLRGYGVGRWVDNNLSVGNVEFRTKVYEADLFGTHGVAQVAPFLEAGRVFHSPSTDPLESLHPVGGVGFRAIAEPFVVGYVDVGWGGEGAAVFSGVNYPF